VLDLHSPRWSELSHAFGSAEDVPRLLTALATLDGDRARAELWFGVWALLCPADTIAPAAFAAVPHLLAITTSRGIFERSAAMHVAAHVESSRHLPTAPSIPDDLVADYAAAIESLPALVADAAVAPWDGAVAQVMAAALLVGKHQPALARSVLQLGDRSS
jgi:hypothetical protein